MPTCAHAPGTVAISRALETAVAIRKLFDGKQLVPGVKALLAHIHRDQAWHRVGSPLVRFSAADAAVVAAGYDRLRSHQAAPVNPPA